MRDKYGQRYAIIKVKNKKVRVNLPREEAEHFQCKKCKECLVYVHRAPEPDDGPNIIHKKQCPKCGSKNLIAYILQIDWGHK
jgi:predicted RNA-binding Zn-ribbon protein involved in translation (DUF1610 family)